MRIAVAREADPAEDRVAATPETVKKMLGLGADVAVEPGAGIKSGIPDADFTAAGATVTPDAVKGADVVFFKRPSASTRPSSPPTRRARSSSPSWTPMATRLPSRPWRMPV